MKKLFYPTNIIGGVVCYYIATIREGKTKTSQNKIRQGQSKKPER